MMLDPTTVCPENVWSFRQNKPSLVADDLERFGVPRSVTYAVLMARGVFKWFSVRRDLIKLKDHLRAEVHRLRAIPPSPSRDARMAAYSEVFRDVRALCHSDRWRAPDFDGAAWAWLRGAGGFRAQGPWVATVRKLRHQRLGSHDIGATERARELTGSCEFGKET